MLKDVLHRLKHKLIFGGNPAREQLKIQLDRTLTRKKETSERVEFLLEKLREFRQFGPDEQALFVGCRNRHELAYFGRLNSAKAIGIDLYSESADIRIMDMHDLVFPDNSFDLVFASHSLEHSYNPQQAINEFVRVMKNEAYLTVEVPVNYQVTGADLVDFKDKSGILRLLSGVDTELIWDRLARKGETGNTSGTDVLALILRLHK